MNFRSFSFACLLFLLSPCTYAIADVDLQFGGGYRMDNWKWKLKEERATFKLRHQNVYLLEASFKTVFDLFDFWFYWRSHGDVGIYGSGKLDQTFRHREKKDAIKPRFVSDLSGGLGVPFWFCRGWLQVAPLIGLSYHIQRIKTEGSPLFSRCHERVNCDYRTNWYGMWAGVDIAYKVNSCWKLFIESAYHFDRCLKRLQMHLADCLSDESSSFPLLDRHCLSHSRGWSGKLGGTMYYDCYSLTFSIDYQRRRSNAHKERVKWEAVGAHLQAGVWY